MLCLTAKEQMKTYISFQDGMSRDEKKILKNTWESNSTPRPSQKGPKGLPVKETIYMNIISFVICNTNLGHSVQ